ncbi:hypothetical protein IW262DRAFT_1496152 [Armillaria fumosa]|nr:hypothetical protein IW262DRAFT_1496152 [Armillaria fumosa]
MSDYVPSIQDLRVKLCYICREEELFDKPEIPPRIWIHPCKCALVAHEACLLKWIQTAQATSAEAGERAMTCPQCRTPYEIESRNPRLLRILSWCSRQLPTLGRVCLWTGFAGFLVSMQAGIYVLLTGYGAHAIQQFFGQEMYDFVLTDDPANWPIMAYIQLPLIPISLVVSRYAHVSPIMPTIIACFSLMPRGIFALTHHSNYANNIRIESSLWPPSPYAFACVLLPITNAIYRACFERLSYKILGTTDPTEYEDNLRFVFNADDEQRDREGEQPQPPAVAPVEGQAPEPNPPPAVVPAPPANGDAVGQQLADITIEIKSPSRIGRRIGGALLLPTIANRMGSLLLMLSKHSLYMRRFLGVRPPWQSQVPFPVAWLKTNAQGKPIVPWGLVLRAFWGGVSPWAELDPVWWRNSIGFGIFIVAKDCMKLLYRWLVKREKETRKVKDRPFSEVDISNLDLIKAGDGQA